MITPTDSGSTIITAADCRETITAADCRDTMIKATDLGIGNIIAHAARQCLQIQISHVTLGWGRLSQGVAWWLRGIP